MYTCVWAFVAHASAANVRFVGAACSSPRCIGGCNFAASSRGGFEVCTYEGLLAKENPSWDFMGKLRSIRTM